MDYSANSTDLLKFPWSQAPEFSPPEPENLLLRKQQYANYFQHTYQALRQEAAIASLHSQNSFLELAQHCSWMDAWITFTWEFVQEESKALKEELFRESHQKLSYLEDSIPNKKQNIEDLKQHLFDDQGKANPLDSAEFSYFSNQLEDLTQQIKGMEKERESINDSLPLLQSKTKALRKSLPFCIFARGGYGRGELSFSSDVDLGYCLNPQKLSPLELLILQELFRRMEELFHETQGNIASQYLELGEDFTRFHDFASLHALPSLLEGRILVGQNKVLQRLKKEIHQAIPLQRICLWLMKQQDSLKPMGNERMELKEGWGGLRHLQYSLWMALIFFKPSSSSSSDLLELLEEKGLLSRISREHLLGALEFYNSYRNFLGLYDCYQDILLEMEETELAKRELKVDLLDDNSSIAFLKLVHRFTTIDDLDRFRLFSMNLVSRESKALNEKLVDRTLEEDLTHFRAYKHLGSGRVNHLVARGAARPHSSQTHGDQERSIAILFSSIDAIYELFEYLATKGLRLHPKLTASFTAHLPLLLEAKDHLDQGDTKGFLTRLFQAEYTHRAIEQMWAIALPLDRNGEHISLLGLFLPEADRMRYLLRNVNIHAYPLCEHSLLALEQVETEAAALRQSEPELWRYLSREDLFALKWSTFFHDLGKINPYKDHEQYGPNLSTKMLMRWGWNENGDTLDTIRLLVRHHQSVVRFSRLSTHLDLGIVKFFELAMRDPRLMILLYLVNVADFKSVNPMMRDQAQHLEDFFNQTLEILASLKKDGEKQPLIIAVENFLDRQLEELKVSVMLQLVLKNCCLKGLDEGLIKPLEQINQARIPQMMPEKKNLHRAVHFLTLAELDEKSLDRHRQTFSLTLERLLEDCELEELSQIQGEHLDWFFASIPNRYLLSMNPQILASQLIELQDFQDRHIRFSYIKGQKGEYDSLLFTGLDDLNLQTKVAYMLGQAGYNIENGKINPVSYHDGKKGFVGFFQFSRLPGGLGTPLSEMENKIDHLELPSLDKDTKKLHKKTNVQIQFLTEKQKAYQVEEVKEGSFERVRHEKVALKLSFYDQPYSYFKLMASLEAFGIIPEQVTITTIGNQIIDYFYLDVRDHKKLEGPAFETHLQQYLQFDISNQGLA